MMPTTTTEIHTWQALTYHWWVWKLTGLVPPKKSSVWRTLYIVYALVLNLTVTVMFPITLFINCCQSDNLSDFCENFYITISGIVCSLKFLNVFIVRKQLLRIRLILEQLDLRAKTKQEIAALQQGIDSAKYCFVVFAGLFFFAAVTCQLVPYLSTERRLMFRAWFPFDWQSSKRNYLVAHSYQVYTLIVNIFQDLGNDTCPQAYLTILAAHTKALALRIEGVASVVAGGGCIGGGRRRKMAEITWQQQQNYRKLIECIEDHKVIINLFAIIQKVISAACMAQFIASGLAQCCLGIYLLYTGQDFSKLLNITVFMGGITLEIFILCYYGDRLCQEGHNLTDAIYNCNWIEQNRDFKKALLVLMQRSQKTNVIMATIIPVRLPTFVKVTRTAYSIFTVLRKFK